MSQIPTGKATIANCKHGLINTDMSAKKEQNWKHACKMIKMDLLHWFTGLHNGCCWMESQGNWELLYQEAESLRIRGGTNNAALVGAQSCSSSPVTVQVHSQGWRNWSVRSLNKGRTEKNTSTDKVQCENSFFLLFIPLGLWPTGCSDTCALPFPKAPDKASSVLCFSTLQCVQIRVCRFLNTPHC